MYRVFINRFMYSNPNATEELKPILNTMDTNGFGSGNLMDPPLRKAMALLINCMAFPSAYLVEKRSSAVRRPPAKCKNRLKPRWKGRFGTLQRLERSGTKFRRFIKTDLGGLFANSGNHTGGLAGGRPYTGTLNSGGAILGNSEYSRTVTGTHVRTILPCIYFTRKFRVFSGRGVSDWKMRTYDGATDDDGGDVNDRATTNATCIYRNNTEITAEKRDGGARVGDGVRRTRVAEISEQDPRNTYGRTTPSEPVGIFQNTVNVKNTKKKSVWTTSSTLSNWF